MKRYSAAFAAAMIVGLAGCNGGGVPTATVQTSAKLVSVTGAVQVRQPGYRLAAYIAPYTAADIHHISVTLNGQPAGDVMPSGTGNVFYLTFRNLKAETTYNVELTAYAYDGHFYPISVPQGSATQFSTYALGTLETSINTELVTQDVHFNLQLADQTFAGSGIGSVTVNPGTLVNTRANEAASTVSDPEPQAEELPVDPVEEDPDYPCYDPVDPDFFYCP